MVKEAKIAIVDDQELIRDATASLLRSFGYATITFDSADAYLAANERNVGCIVCDVQMPGRSGMELASVLASCAAPPPLILMTAYPDPRMRARGRELGVLALLDKPLDGAVLADIIRSALRD